MSSSSLYESTASSLEDEDRDDVDESLQNAKLQTGIKLPNTVTNRHFFLPTASLILPNSGQAKNANIPRKHSAHPMIT
jgi:hypothetical protein